MSYFGIITTEPQREDATGEVRAIKEAMKRHGIIITNVEKESNYWTVEADAPFMVGDRWYLEFTTEYADWSIRLVIEA